MLAELRRQPSATVAPSRSTSHEVEGGDEATPASSNAKSYATPVHLPSTELSIGPVSGPAIPGFFVYEDKFATPAASPHSLHPLVVIAPSPSATSPETRDVSKGLLAEYPSEDYFNILVDDSFVFLNTYQSMIHSYCRIEEWMVPPENERPDYHLLHTRHTSE
ncbi:hypothetical protein PWT90_08338 [Aphanocladium album]|nr:hypothetical protein PWT90_08338 [Aphanocladium album]